MKRNTTLLIIIALFPIALFAQRQAENVPQRKALVEPDCVIDKIINAVGVGSGTTDFENILDEDLNNSATFVKVASVAVGANPIISVRDRFHLYKSGTTAGFCIVAGGSSSILSLDVVKAMAIMVYNNGVLLKTYPVEEGQSAGVLDLNLIQIPGSEEAVVNLTVKPEYDFDEIGLVYAGGVGLDVINTLKVKYAFVGDPLQHNLTTSGMAAIGATVSAEGWNPVLLGIPFPLVPAERNKLIDDDLENYASLTPILAIGYQGGVKLTSNHVFDAGTEVGFKYVDAGALNLDVGSWIVIKLYDTNNNEVQSETIAAKVLNLGVGKGGNSTTSIVSKVPFSRAELSFNTTIAVNLGARLVKYAFVREKPLTQHLCELNLSMNTNVCDDQTSYQLVSNPTIPVLWTVESKPAGSTVTVSDGGTVKNMDKEGIYVFRATCTDGCGCTDTVQINKGQTGVESSCGTPMTTGTMQVALSDVMHESSGSLISLSNIKDAGNIIDDNTENYAEYTGGLSIAENLQIVGIKKTDGTTFNPELTQKRVGFIIEMKTTGLGADVLQFYQIRGYKNGAKVFQTVVDETNAVSVGLIGNDQSQKMRFSVETPEDDFDEITLWKSGVLTLDIADIRMYYGFIEEASDNCSDPLGCSSTLLSTEQTGSTINYSATGTVSVVSAAGTIAGLGNLIDNDPATAVVITGVQVGAGTVLAVRTGKTLDYRHQLGIILDNKTYLAGITAGTWMTVQTYYDGVETGDKFTNWNVLGLDVIGYGDKKYLMMYPKSRYDEVRITMAGVASVLDTQTIYGLFVRDDRDNDGIPDCLDSNSCETNLTDITVSPICQNGDITFGGKGFPGTVYKIDLPEQNMKLSANTDVNGIFTITFQKLPNIGRFDAIVYDNSDKLVGSIPYQVHPLQTTWKLQPINTDWNEWNNWSNGAPYCCTDVIIPSEASAYPILSQPSDAADVYCCKFIHFEPNTEVVGTYRLTYTKAWVEMLLSANRYYMLTAPLKNMFTGDMFIPATMNGVQSNTYFTTLDNTSSPENRYNPRIFQRLWSSTAPGRLMDNSTTAIQINETNWSNHFNSLKQEYALGSGFSLWVDNGKLANDQTFKFRFPKEHTAYSYFDDLGNATTVTESISRSKTGRFIYEDASGNPTLPLNVVITNQTASKYFLIGNPFMAHLDVAKFMAANHLLSIKVYDGNTTNTTIRTDGELLSNQNGLTSIAPMQSFFAEVQNAGTSITVTFEEDMLVSAASNLLKSPDDLSKSLGNADKSTMYVRATLPSGIESATLIRESASASPEIVPGEDSEVLFDNEVHPTIAIYSIRNGQGLDIQQTGQLTSVPLGIYTNGPSDITLSFDISGELQNRSLELHDKETGIVYPLEAAKEIKLQNVSTNTGRFMIRETGLNPTEKESTLYVYTTESGEKAIIKSLEPNIISVKGYTTNGTLTYEETLPEVAECNVPLFKGMNILQIRTKDGTEETVKVWK